MVRPSCAKRKHAPTAMICGLPEFGTIRVDAYDGPGVRFNLLSSVAPVGASWTDGSNLCCDAPARNRPHIRIDCSRPSGSANGLYVASVNGCVSADRAGRWVGNIGLTEMRWSSIIKADLAPSHKAEIARPFRSRCCSFTRDSK